VYRAFLSVYRALLSVYRALLSVCRTRLSVFECMDFGSVCTSLYGSSECV